MIFYILTKENIVQGIMIFSLGLLIGATGSMLHSARMIDNTLIEIETLRSELAEREIRVERLEESLQEHRKRIVRNISIELNIKEQHLNLKLSTTIRQLIDDLIGREIEGIDPDLIFSIFDNRIIEVDDVSYLLNLKWLSLSDTLTLHIEIDETFSTF